MTVDYPSNIDDEAIPASGPQYGYALSVPTSMSAFLCRVGLSELCREVVDAVPSSVLESSDISACGSEIDYTLILDLDTRFQTFTNSLPTFFKLDEQSIQQTAAICQERPYIAWQRTFLHFGINTRICHLHRPFHLEGFTNPKYAYSRKMCVRSAETVLHLRRSMEEIGASISLNPSRFWLIVQHVFRAAIILATDVSLRPDSPEAGIRCEEVLAACRMLERSRHESATLDKAIQKNTHTLLAVMQNQLSLPRAGSHTMNDVVIGSSVLEPSGKSSGTTMATGQGVRRDSIRGASVDTIPTTIPDSSIPYMQTMSEPLSGDWSADLQNQQYGIDSWGGLWSDMFGAGLELDMPQWSSILNDMEFMDFSGEVM